MSLQEEIALKELELEVLKEMRATDYNNVPKDTLFAVSDSLEAVAQGQGRLRYFSHVDGDCTCRFFVDGCTSETTEDTDWPVYHKRVHVSSEVKFRKWVKTNTNSIGDLHFHKSNWPKDLPTNYLEILKEGL